MKISKNYKKLCFALGLTGIVSAGAVSAASGTQDVSATFRNIQITYNGAVQSMAVEPFLVNGSVYVPLRAVGDIFGATPTWNPATNTVSIVGGASSSSQAEIANLNYQLQALTQQLNEANSKLTAANNELASLKASAATNTNTNTSGGAITTAQLRETENYLNQNFSDALSNNINLYYQLTLTGSQINVTMTYETRTENTAFKNLSQTKIEAFMNRIGNNIAATHNDVIINGTIEYSNESTEKASFTRAKNGRYTYSHAFDNQSLKQVIDDATGGYFYFNGTNPNSLYITDSEVDIRDTKSTINVKIYLQGNNDSFKASWGTNVLPTSSTPPTTTPLTASGRKTAVANTFDDIYYELTSIAQDYDVNIYLYYGSYDEIARMDANENIQTDGIDN